MALKDYREEFNNVFTDFENINISFDEITAKIPASRIEGDENQASERFFRSMNASVKELKETIQKARALMADDSKEEEAMNKFEILMDQVRGIRAEQKDFQEFLKKSEYGDLEIPGMRDIYKLFSAANGFMGIYDQMDQYQFLDKIDTANQAYAEAHQKYKDHKKAFVEKYKDVDLNDLSTRVDKAKNIIDDKVYQRGKIEEQLNALPEEEKKIKDDIDAIRENIDNIHTALSRTQKDLNGYEHYLHRYDQAIQLHLNRKEELKKEIDKEELKTQRLLKVKNEVDAQYNKLYEKIQTALDDYKDNKIAKTYIKQQMRNIETSVLFECIDDFNKRSKEKGMVKMLPAPIKEMLERNLTKEGPNGGIGLNDDEPLESVLNALLGEMGKLDEDFEAFQNDSLDEVLNQYKEKANSLFTFENDFFGQKRIVDNLHARRDVKERAILEEINEVRNDNGSKLWIIPSESVRERLMNLPPEEFQPELMHLKELAESDIKALNKQLDEANKKLEKKLLEEENISVRRRTLNNERAAISKEIKKLKENYNHEKGALNKLNTLHQEYKENNRARAEAISTYNQNKGKIEQQELFTMQNAASDFYDRVDDAAKGHKNSTEFQTMSNILKDVRDMGSATREQKAAKLTELKAAIETYQKAKEEQNRWRWIPTNLRKTRLQFAAELLKWTDEGLKAMEKGSAKHLKQLEETYAKLSEIQEKKPKDKEKDAFTASMGEKFKQAAASVKKEHVNEDANEKVNEEDRELGGK